MSMTSANSSNLAKRLARNKPKQKQKKRQNEEDDMIKKAVLCLDKVTNEEQEDGLAIFGRHIASELREIPYPHLQRWAKLQIQQVIFTAQDSNADQSSYLPQHSRTCQPRMEDNYDYDSQFIEPSNRSF